MNGLIDYVRWGADNVGVELEEKELCNLTIELINCEKYNTALKELQEKIIEVSDSKHLEKVKERN